MISGNFLRYFLYELVPPLRYHNPSVGFTVSRDKGETAVTVKSGMYFPHLLLLYRSAYKDMLLSSLWSCSWNECREKALHDPCKDLGHIIIVCLQAGADEIRIETRNKTSEDILQELVKATKSSDERVIDPLHPVWTRKTTFTTNPNSSETSGLVQTN
jgi:hypothetical protein